MEQEVITQKSVEVLIKEFINSTGQPETVATEIDDIIFDWIQNSETPFEDWHKNLLFTLKQLRDLFKDLQTTIDQQTV